ncbi:MAG: MOSC domain-containing protein [Spirosomataceae bacterium]
MLKVSQIFIYPVKSLAGISLNESAVTERGLQYDRRWVLVDESNYHITQREFAEMALIDVAVGENQLILKHRTKDFGECSVPFEPQTNDSRLVGIWDDEVLAVRVSDEVDAWFQQVLGVKCYLFYQPDVSIRPVDKKYAINNEHVSLSDGYPILIAGQASIDDLGKKIGQETDIRRFRPNIVFTGGEAYAEDNFSEFSINGVALHGVKNCARCPIPNINPDTAEISKETIKTLSSYRTRNNKVFFGQNVLVKTTGTIKIGDEIKLA